MGVVAVSAATTGVTQSGSVLEESPAATYVAGATEADRTLPDAPVPVATTAAGTQAIPNQRVAGRLDKVILAGEVAPKLGAGDKILLGIRASVSPFTAVGWVASAGYSQATNGSPNYGQTGKGFAQRLGAAAARSTSEDIFTDSVLAPALHQDPRYYQMGPGHNVAVRTVYAVSRVFITRTDGGRETLNVSLLGGNLAGAALTQAYYPPINRGVTEVMKTYGTSLAGSAVGFGLSEFFTQFAGRFVGLKTRHE